MKDLFKTKEKKLISLARKFYKWILNLPEDTRKDEKKRTGIKVLLWEVGTDNFFSFSVGRPSKKAEILVVEKAVRSHTLNHFSSFNSVDSLHFRFGGCVTVLLADNERRIQASVSGLMTEEDTALAVLLLSHLLKWSIATVIDNIKNHGGFLPSSISTDNHYICKALRAFRE